MSAARYYPLRFNIVRQLMKLASTTNLYIPLDSYILHPLQSNEFKKKQLTASSSMKKLNFAIMLRLSEAQLKSKSYVEGTMDQVNFILLYIRIFSIFRNCFSFILMTNFLRNITELFSIRFFQKCTMKYTLILPRFCCTLI